MKKVNLFEENGFNDLGMKKFLVHDSGRRISGKALDRCCV